jgi:DNA primase
MDTDTTRKQELLILALEEDGIELIDKGNHYKLLCPFHDDNNPSCVIYKDSEYYQCYACGEKGDVYNYLWHARKMSYKNALKHYNMAHSIRTVIKRQPSLIEHIVSEERQGVNVIAKYGAELINLLLIQELKELSDGKD